MFPFFCVLENSYLVKITVTAASTLVYLLFGIVKVYHFRCAGFINKNLPIKRWPGLEKNFMKNLICAYTVSLLVRIPRSHISKKNYPLLLMATN